MKIRYRVCNNINKLTVYSSFLINEMRVSGDDECRQSAGRAGHSAVHPREREREGGGGDRVKMFLQAEHSRKAEHVNAESELRQKSYGLLHHHLPPDTVTPPL